MQSRTPRRYAYQPRAARSVVSPPASEWGGSQVTLGVNAVRDTENASGDIYIRFITPENALGQRISNIPAFPSPFSLSTKLTDLRKLIKSQIFSKAVNAPFTVDLHLDVHPLLSTEDLTLFDFDFVGTRSSPLNLFVVLRYTGNIGAAKHSGADLKSTSNVNAWHPVERCTQASISTFCASLEIIKRKITDNATQRRFLTALWQTTHFPPAVRAMSNFFDSRTMLPEEKAALAQIFQALCLRAVPDWAIFNKPENALEGSRQLLGWLLDQVTACKRGGTGKQDWTRKAIIKPVNAAAVQAGSSGTADSSILCITLQNGDTLDVSVEFLDKSVSKYPSSRRLVLGFRGRFDFDGNSYLEMPKDAGSLLDHRILHHPNKDGFYEQIINTSSLPALCTVAPLSLSSSRPPVLTLNNEGLISIFEFGGECADEWARIWNPVTGVQLIMSNDQGQALAKTLKPVIQARKASGAWPLDGWDVGSLNANTVDTRKPTELVMICIDCSWSMDDPAYRNEDADLQAHEKLTAMAATKILFRGYTQTVSNYKLPVLFGVMKFASTVTTMTEELTPLLAEVEPQIEALYPHGMTAMWDCVYQAGEQLVREKVNHPDAKLRIIVLTDGDDNQSKQTNKSTYSYLWENDIVLDAIVFGTYSYDCLFKICKVTGGYAMRPTCTQEVIQIADTETMLDQTRRPPFIKDSYLPLFDTVQPLAPITINAFSVPAARSNPHETDEFMSLANASTAYGKTKNSANDGAQTRNAGDDARRRRMLIEIKDMAENPHPDMDIYVSESNMSFWKIVMQGPSGSKYQNGTFVLFLDMTDDYPRKAPEARFLTPIMHPNINKHGRVCHEILDQDWRAETKARDILCCIYGLLMAPERNTPVDVVATLQFWTDEALYTEEVSKHIKQFANKDRKDWAHRIVRDFDAVPGDPPPLQVAKGSRRVSDGSSGPTHSTGRRKQSGRYNPSALRSPVAAIPPATLTARPTLNPQPEPLVDPYDSYRAVSYKIDDPYEAADIVPLDLPPRGPIFLDEEPPISRASSLYRPPQRKSYADRNPTNSGFAPRSVSMPISLVDPAIAHYTGTTIAAPMEAPGPVENHDLPAEMPSDAVGVHRTPSIYSTSSNKSSMSAKLKKAFGRK
ncbi:hypothetical protein ABW19_dt0200005 [Dactylella cylindrospora]|nr:hypothetical protein ABW19_dt0200005 [Dactylella cylindrospora]